MTTYSVRLLQEKDYADAFRVTLQKRYQALQNLQDDEEDEDNNIIERDWMNIKQVWAKSCEEVVGKKKRHNQPWILSETLKKIDRKMKKEEVIQEQRSPWLSSSIRSAIKKSRTVSDRIREDKLKILPSMPQEAATQRNMKELREATKKLVGKYKQDNEPVRDKNGNMLTNKEDQLKRWVEHFEKLLNRTSSIDG